MVELLGLENLTNAFGLLLLIHGVASFLGMPIAARIVRATGLFNPSFIFSGCSLIFSSILLMPIKRISDWEQRKIKA